MNTRTGSQRFSCLLQGKLPDRVPVCCGLLDQGAKELGMSLKEYYSKGEYVAEAQLRLRKKYGYDILWGFFYMGHIAELLGCQHMIYSSNGPPNVGHMVIQDYKDIEKFEIPGNLEELPGFRELEQCIRLLKKEEGGRYPILSAAMSSFTLPSILIGMSKWMELLFMGPAVLRDELLQKCSDFCSTHVNALRQAGADLIAYTNPMASMDFIDSKQFKDLALPWIKKDIDRVGNQNIVYFNGGGRINATISPIIEATGISVFYINPMDNVKEAKEMIKGRGISIGAINDIKLIDWTAEEIEAEVKEIMEEGAPGGGFIFGTLLMPYLIPEEKIRIMLDAAYKYGEYPKNGTI